MRWSRRHVLVGLAGSALPLRAESGAKLQVAIQPYGKALAARDVAFVKTAIAAFFDVDVHVLDRVPHPAAAWTAPRQRWRAGVLLDDFVARKPREAVQILGLTRADISVTKGDIPDWGVLGYGMVGGPACVVSRHRCRIGAKGPRHIRQRLAKVCLHELGHTLGSGHCPTRGCLMHDAEGQVKPLDIEHTFCADTMALFRKRGAPLRDDVKLPW